MPVPTIEIPGTLPQDWAAWQQLLATAEDRLIVVEGQTIDIYDAFEVWCKVNNIQPIYAIRNVPVGWGQVGAADATTSTDVILRPIYEMTKVTGGIALESLKLGGHSTLGIAKKSVIIAVVLAMVGSLITPNMVPAEDQEAIEDTITPFTIDGENVPVFIRNGKTYLQQELIDAVRATMVDRGVFNTEQEMAPTPATNQNLPFIRLSNSQTFWQVLSPDMYSANISKWKEININDLELKRDGNWYNITDIINPNTNESMMPDAVYAFQDTNGTLAINAIWKTRPPADGFRYVLSNGYILGYDENIWSCTLNGNTVYFSYAWGQGSGSWRYQESFDAGANSARQVIVYGLLYGTEAEGVEGWNPQEQAYADLTKTFSEVNLDVAGDCITVPNPNESDLYNEDTWVPAALRDFNIWTDGSTQEEIDTANDGEPDDAVKDEITDLLQELIDTLLRDPDNPDEPVIPVIEVGDSGDTPPAEPPLLSGSSNGLWAIYNPSLQQVHDFGAWLWSDSLIDSIKRQFSNSPIDAVIGFHMIYCTPITGAQKTIKAGYLDSPVQAAEVTNQYAEIDCGTVTVTEFYGNAIDYMKTRIALYLPFIGIVPLDAGVVMGSVLSLKYRIDVLTGTCLAQVKVIKENSSAVIYTYQGNCSVQIPLTGSTYTGMVGALLGGVTAGVSIMTGNLAGAAAGIKGAVSSVAQGHNIQHSGTIGSNAGALGIRIPYLIVTHPVQRMPVDYAAIEGIPSNYSVRIGDCSGYTRVIYGHMENITGATADELQMIRDALMEGIII